MTLWRKLALGVVSTTFAASCWGMPFLKAHADTIKSVDAANPNVQLICDEDSVAAGGSLTYHILYHNVQNKNHSNVWLKVKVPEGLDVDLEKCGCGDDAVWDATTRVLTWHLQDVKSNGAHVVHFNLKVHGDCKDGTIFDLSCVSDEDGDECSTPVVPVHTGKGVDQPFFVGYEDGNFHPHAYITRAQAAAVVARVKGLTDASAPAYPFTDVKSNYWAKDYINKVVNAGYMVGYADGSFHPDAPITRAELVRLVLEMRGVHPIPLDGFDDTKGHHLQDEIGTAKWLGFVAGEGHNKFDPDGGTERQAAAALFDVGLFRGPLVNGDTQVAQHFPDVSRGSWSFGWVEESAVVAHESLHKGRGLEYLIRYLPDQTKPM